MSPDIRWVHFISGGARWQHFPTGALGSLISTAFIAATAARESCSPGRAEAIRKNGVDAEGPLERWFGEDPESQRASRTNTNMVGDGRSGRNTRLPMPPLRGAMRSMQDCWPSVECPALFLTGSGRSEFDTEMAKTDGVCDAKGMGTHCRWSQTYVNLTAPRS